MPEPYWLIIWHSLGYVILVLQFSVLTYFGYPTLAVAAPSVKKLGWEAMSWVGRHEEQETTLYKTTFQFGIYNN